MKKVIYININSNHDILSFNKPGIKNFLLKNYYSLCYKLCDLIICLSPTQLEPLKNLGLNNLKMIPLGAAEEIVLKYTNNKFGKYYISAGLDSGRNFDFISSIFKEKPYVVLNSKNRLGYRDYLKKLARSKALVLNIKEGEKVSDLSGITTCCEALLLNKPVLINPQPWLKPLLKKNYYVYKDQYELNKLLNKKIKFKKMNKEHLTLNSFRKEILKEIKILE